MLLVVAAYSVACFQVGEWEQAVVLQFGRPVRTAVDPGLYFKTPFVQNFVKFNERANYNIVTAENYEGEHLMRGPNIEFTLRVKVVPYAPVP